jgi:hypothetical protein
VILLKRTNKSRATVRLKARFLKEEFNDAMGILPDSSASRGARDPG